ncbi:hypothetical protein ACHAQH_002997 [Verticillium albo-atrum]
MSYSTCNNVSPECPVELTIYGDYFTLGATATYASLFGLCLAAQLPLAYKARLWSYGAWLFAGTAFEFIGYVARSAMVDNPWNFAAFIAQNLCLVLGPTLVAAAISVTFKHLVLWYGPEHSLLRPNLYPYVFVGTDVISIIIQAAGGGLASGASADSEGSFKLGNNLLLAGVSFQVVNMTFCGGLILIYVWRRKRALARCGAGGLYDAPNVPPYLQGSPDEVRQHHKKLRMFICGLAAAYCAIIIRCIYRIPEMALGWGSTLMQNEATFMALDGLMLLIACCSLTVFHPALLFPFMGKGESTKSVRQASAESSSLASPGRNSNDSTARSHLSFHLSSYSDGPTPAAISPFSTSTAASHGDTPCFNLNDLGLLHHWTYSTSKNIFGDPKLDPLWQVTIPEIAAQHDFLMRGILCLSALHLAHEKKLMRSSFIREAAAHHNVAIQGFNQAISEMTESNSEALFAFASLNIICVFALYGRLGEDTTGASRRSTKDRIMGLEWVNMMRGVKVLLDPVHRVVWGGPLRVLLEIGNWEDLNPDNAASVSALHLREIRSAWQGSNDADAYDETLHLLIKSFMFVEQFETMDEDVLESWGHNRALSGSTLFLHFAPEYFFAQVRQRQPPALIMFAYLGVALHSQRKHWFLGSWGKDIVHVVDDLLGDYWRPWTSWPLEVVGSE